MKSFVISAAKKTLYVIAALIIIAAILVSVSRLSAPLLDKHRSDFEKWTTALLGTPVTIEKIRVSWYIYQPEITLNQVTVLNKETNEPVLQIRKVRIFFSIPQSLWQRKPVTNAIMIAGADLNIHQSKTGEISIQGFPSIGGFNSEPFKSETKFTDVLGFLSQQPRLTLRDIDLRYTEFSGQKRFVTLYNLSIQNSVKQNTILGKAILHQAIPTELTFTVQWNGNVMDLSTIKAQGYVYVSGLSLSQWMKGLSFQGWRINDGIVSAKIWGTWEQNALQRIQSTFQFYHVDLLSTTDKSTHPIQRLSGSVGWKREGNNQVIAGEDILIDLPTHLWPVTSFYLSLASNADTTLSPKAITLGYVDLSDIQTFLSSSPPHLPDAVRQLLASLNIKGALQDLSVTFGGQWNDWKQLSLNGNVSQLSFDSWHQLPSVRNLSGFIKWNGTQGKFSFDSKRAQFQYDALFEKPIRIDQLVGDVNVKQDAANTWTLGFHSLQLTNNDVTAKVSGTFAIPISGSPVSDLNANFNLQDVAHVTRYLPTKIFDKDFVAWLKSAFLLGDVTEGHAVLRGAVKEFPFNNNNGTFSVTCNVNNIDFHYAPDWPIMRHLNGKLNFSSRELIIDVDKTQLFDISIPNVHGVLSDFSSDKPLTLVVQSGNIKADFAEALRFVHASPLENTIGHMFQGIALQGPIALKLGLSMLVSDPSKTKIDGALTINKGSMDLLPWHLTLKKLNGGLHFTEEAVDAKQITGLLFDKPFQFSLSTLMKTKNISIVRANFTNSIAISDLENWLKLPFSKVINGTTDVTGQLDVSLKTSLELQLRSKLIGITVDLPDLYGKKAQTERDFSTNIIMQENQPLKVKLSYGNLLSIAATMNRKGEKFNLIGANLRMGNGGVSWPTTSGLYITGEIDKLDWNDIKSYMNSSNTSQLSGITLRGVDVVVNKIDVGGQHLTKIRTQITKSPNHWDVNINGSDIIGQINIPAKLTPQGTITAEFEKLTLKASTESNSFSPSFDAKSFPSISLFANNVSYNDMPLGQVFLKTSPSANGLTIKSLRMVSSRMNLTASGEWIKSGKNDITRLHGNVMTQRLSDLLSSFGLDLHNFIATKGNLTFNFDWQNAPYSPTLSSLNGEASLDIGRGRIVDIGQESGAKMDLGRMLSIFSLQSIPRRLTFDFSDVFQKGYSFDSVKGDFNFRNGNVYTDNMSIDGPAAKVAIDGRIGLNNKDYNISLNVTPYVTSSIPVAAALLTAGNPLVGAAAFAVSSIIGSQVNKVATYHYLVTGPWMDPTWTSMSSADKNKR